jgi:hypothetical protein
VQNSTRSADHATEEMAMILEVIGNISVMASLWVIYDREGQQDQQVSYTGACNGGQQGQSPSKVVIMTYQRTGRPSVNVVNARACVRECVCVCVFVRAFARACKRAAKNVCVSVRECVRVECACGTKRLARNPQCTQ